MNSSLDPIRAGRSKGFSLVEVLTVLSITAILLALVISGMRTAAGTAFNSEVSDLGSTFARARAYAMANNTYVFVGIEEVNAATSATATQTAGSGRIGVLVVATSDGSRGYDPTTTSVSTTLPQTALTPFANTQLITVSPLRHFDNVHIVTLTSASITAFGSNFPITSTSMTPVPYYDLSAAASASKITFNWPLGGSQYVFSGNPGSVIQFNPQGEAQIVTGSNTDTYLQWIEIDVVPTHGSTVPATYPNQSSILIDGASGGVSIYRT